MVVTEVDALERRGLLKAAASAVAPTSVIWLELRSMRWSDVDFSKAASSEAISASPMRRERRHIIVSPRPIPATASWTSLFISSFPLIGIQTALESGATHVSECGKCDSGSWGLSK